MIKLTTLTFLFLTTIFSYGQCTVTLLNATISSCQLPGNTYVVDGSVEFVNPPLTGTLIVSVDDGVSIYDTIINGPFVNNATYSISNLPANGNALSVNAVFSDDMSCFITGNSIAPSSCACVADIGTFTYNAGFTFGNSHFIINSIPFEITGNLDHTFANEHNNGANYDTAMGYIAFDCQTVGSDLYSDPCFVGVLGSGPSFTVNCSDISGGMLPNPVYLMPITLYDASNYIYSNTVDSNFPCYEIGVPQAVYCLSPILVTPSTNPANGQVSFQFSGGLPAYHTSNYTISNVLPASASMDLSSVAFNGTAVLSGLLDGQAYSFTVVDDAGSEKLVSSTYSSVENNLDTQFTFFPNPVKDILNINGLKENTTFTITTLTGQVVLKKQLSEDGVIDLQGIVPGVYIVSSNSESGSASFRTIKL